jgi:MoaA/NifB/PqqE/SkfB family radical SAM enzyme
MMETTKFIQKWSKRMRIFARLLGYRLGIDKRPVFGVLTVTPHCDFRCKYCFADYHARTMERDLPTERMLKTIDELADLGVIYLNVHGGEALLRKDIGTILRYALSKNMFVNLITNGTLVKRRWDDIKAVDVICISMDGSEQNNDSNRGKGTYKIATEAIDFVLSKGVPVRIGATITRYTKDDLEWLAEWAKKRNIYIQPFLLFDQENLPQELWMTRAENQRALLKLIELKKKGYPIFYSMRTLEYALNWPFDKAIIRKKDLEAIKVPKTFKPIQCHYKLLNVLIESSGLVRTCNIMARIGTHVSILDKSVKEAKEELLRIDDCMYCYHLPQMEFSLLMSLDFIPVLGQFLHQIKEDVKSLLIKRCQRKETANGQ